MIKLKNLLIEMGAWVDDASTTDEITVMDKINTFIQTLSTNDSGEKQFENYVVKYQGFNEQPGVDQESDNETIEMSEDRLLDQWEEQVKIMDGNRNQNVELKEANWSGNIFYAVFILGGIGSLNETNKSTLAVRRYYKRHPAKVRANLKKTQDDRVIRNRDRRTAIKKHGKGALKGKDIHHPKGVNGGKTRIVKSKNHGPDKKK